MKTLMIAAALVVLCSTAPRAQEEQLGAGPILGSPLGLTLKFYATNTHAVDAGAGEIGGDLAVYGDYLWHVWPQGQTAKAGKLGFYLGLGGRVRNADDDVLVGMRTPLGGLFRFSAQPVELFCEVAPVIEFAPSRFVQLDGGVGARYFFAGGK